MIESSVLNLSNDHRYIVFTAKVPVEDRTPAEEEAAKKRTWDMLMASRRPKFQVPRYSGQNTDFSVKAVFNRLTDKLDEMGCLFRDKHLVQPYWESLSKQRLITTTHHPSTTAHIRTHHTHITSPTPTPT